MGTDAAEVAEALPCHRAIKVHRLMCTELMKLVDKISKILPEIEAARPRCSSGIQPFCLLNSAIEKAKSVIQYCSESSKLYLGMQYCRDVKDQETYWSKSQIQNLVPILLAAEISKIVADLRAATFSLDSSEEDAGKVVRAFLQQYASATDSTENSAIEAIQFASSRLNMTSQKALLIEKRSIKKLLDKFGDGETSKKQILVCLLNLLRKYGKLVVREQKENPGPQHSDSFSFSTSCKESVEVESHVECGCDELQANMLSGFVPPEEFKCPISSRLMYDPVVIASGQTFERIWIQKWFDEGHVTCPKTKRSLTHLSLTPNNAMKDLISKWCLVNGITIPDPCIQSTEVRSWETSSTSIASLSSSMNNLRLPIDYSNVSVGSLDTSYSSDSSHVKLTNGDSHKFQSYQSTHELDSTNLSKLDTLSWDSQCKAVEDAKCLLVYESEDFYSLGFENFGEPLIRFLKDAHNLEDIKAQRTGSQLLFEFISKYRHNIQYLHEDAYNLLVSLLNSEVTEEALAIIELLSCQQRCIPKLAASGAFASILNILDTQTSKSHIPAIKILRNVSSESDFRSLLVSLEFIPKLVRLFKDTDLSGYLITILRNLCDYEDARVSIAETDGCIASIADLLELDSHECQELAVAVLLSLCSQRIKYCRMVMDEGVIPALVDISVNGNEKGKASAMELLRILRDNTDSQEHYEPDLNFSVDSNYHFEEKKSSSKARTKISVFSIFKSLAPAKRK